MSIMQRLYDSEINASVSGFWDNGFLVTLGDGINGFLAEAWCRTWAEVEEWLDSAARHYYPDSEFARGITQQ